VNTGINAVYVPPVDNVSVSTLIPRTLAETAGVVELPLKFNELNQLPSVNVGATVPDVIDKLGALVVLPPVVPTLNVLVTDI